MAASEVRACRTGCGRAAHRSGAKAQAEPCLIGRRMRIVGMHAPEWLQSTGERGALWQDRGHRYARPCWLPPDARSGAERGALATWMRLVVAIVAFFAPAVH